MNQRFFRIEHILYAAALALALLIRLAKLGSVPLNNEEAALALQAWEVARGGSPLIDPHPAYLALTSALMFLFNATAWTARFWPALAGSLLVLLPLFFRDRLGRLPAVMLAFFLAFDPGLLAVSRQASSLPLALLFPLLAAAFWWKGYRLPAGIAAGMALLSGPAVWPGILALAAAWLVANPRKPDELAENRTEVTPGAAVYESLREIHSAPDGSAGRREGFAWTPVLAAVIFTVLLIGTLFFRIPNGLSAVAGSLAAYLRGWFVPVGASPGLLLVALFAYALLPLILGLWGGLRGLLQKDPVDRFLLVWWGVALILALVYPGRMVSDLLWSILPLWALAARQFSRMLNMPAFDRLPVLGQTLLATVIFAFISLTSISLTNLPNPQPQVYLPLALAALMLISSAILVGWGWSRMVALRGLIFGLALVLLVYTISAGWDAAGFTGKSARDLFAVSPPLENGHLLTSTIEDLNQWAASPAGGLEVVVVDVPSPALRWQLREFQRVRYVENLPAEVSPDLVISPNLPNLALAATYRGQRFVLAEETTWTGLRGQDWFRWAVFRSLPAGSIAQQQVILWARLDLFPAELAPADQGVGLTGANSRD